MQSMEKSSIQEALHIMSEKLLSNYTKHSNT